MNITAVRQGALLMWLMAGSTFFLPATAASTQTPQIWHGGFEIEDMWGAMELELTDVSIGKRNLRVRFTPNGHTDAPSVREERVTRDRVSFVTLLDGADYRFIGKHKEGSWAGTIEGPRSKGTWRLTPLLPPETRGNGYLPRPTGRMAVGRVDFDWEDDKREELETLDSNDHRRLMVYLFYPARTTAGLTKAAYLPDVDELGEGTDAQTGLLRRVHNHALSAAPCIPTGRPLPVVLFAPGGGQKVLSYTALLEDLASHGYFVAAIDPPYNALAVKFTDGTVLRRLPPAGRGWEVPKTRDDMPRIYEQMVVHWARDMSFVLDRLTDLNQSDKRFAGRLDIARVGAMGHSRGGQAAGKVRLLDPRFLAAVNLDGNIRGRAFPPDSQLGGGKQPFLWLEKQLPWPKKDLDGLTLRQFEDMWGNGDRLMQSITSKSIRMQIARPGIDHLDFGDTAILDGTRSENDRGGKERTIAIIRRATLTFFDRELKGDDDQRLERLIGVYPEIKMKRYQSVSLPR